MADLDFENIDTVKAFFTIVLGAAVGAFLFYLYARLLRPRLQSVEQSASLVARPVVSIGSYGKAA